MSLVRYINNKCPCTSHTHTTGNNYMNESCAICSPQKYNFSRFCSKYYSKKIIYFSNKQEYAFRECLTNLSEYYLPTELQDLILTFTDIVETKFIKIKLNKEGIDHLMSCSDCSYDFVNWLDKNSCNIHILPRIRDDEKNIL